MMIMELGELHRSDRVLSEAKIRRLCHVAYLGDHNALCRVLGRFKMFVDTRDLGLAGHLMLDGYWEMWVTEIIVSLVREGMIVADIGANLGYFTILMTHLVGEKGMVHAFEPNPQMAGLIGKSLSINGLWRQAHVHQVALSNSDQQAMALIVPPGEPKNAHMVPWHQDLPENAVRVETARLDSRIDWQAIEFAKVDVEGAEEMVWAGMSGMLDSGKLKTVILEFTPGRYQDPGAFLRDLMAPGFSLARIDFSEGIVEISPSQVLASAPNEDIMLVLRR